jgi:flagellar biosynthesis/type III secretory pathway protein FliH
MIVRDAILAEEPYTVAAAAAQPGMRRDLARPVPVYRPAAFVAQPADDLAHLAQPSASAAPVLTLAAVAAWLAEQDHDVLRELPEVAVELAEIREDAYTAGFDAGRIEGSVAAAQQTARRHELLKASIEAVRADCLREQTRLEEQCVEIVVAAIAQIAGPLLATRAAAVGAVAAALSKAKAAAELTVRVNPTDLSLLEEQRSELAALTATPTLHLLGDAQVALGGCLIDSPVGTLDARFEVQLQGLFEALRVARAQVAGA